MLWIGRAFRDIYELYFRRRAVRRDALALIRTDHADAILATSDDGPFLIAAYQAARSTHTPLHVLLLDIYARNNYSVVRRVIARIYEPRILRYAKRVFVTNARTDEHYRSLYGIECVVVEHLAPRIAPKKARRARGSPILTYTGNIYWAQRDAIRNVVEALQLMGGIQLEVVTEQDEIELQRMGLWTPCVRLRHASPDQALAQQADADVLLLPLSFRRRAVDVIRTAEPGKMAEYLVSGVPVLVHAPQDSHISTDARSFGWGLVVDRPDIQEIAHALRALLTDHALRAELVSNAFALASRRHNEETIAERFRRELGFPPR